MANIFTSQSISYITIDEVRESTLKGDLIGLDDDGIKTLIVKSEKLVNDYLWYKVDVASSDNDTIQDIKVATLYIVEQIFENWDSISMQTDSVVSESTGDRSVTYESNKDDSIILWIPKNAITILGQYRKNFYRQVI